MTSAPGEPTGRVLLICGEPALEEALESALVGSALELVRALPSDGTRSEARWPDTGSLEGLWKSASPPTSLVVAFPHGELTEASRERVARWAHRLVGSGAVVLIGELPTGSPTPRERCEAAALTAFVASLARAVAPRHRVNAILPGSLQPNVDPLPRRRAGIPSDIATAAAFFAGSGSRFISGATLRVDGGAHLWWALGAD